MTLGYTQMADKIQFREITFLIILNYSFLQRSLLRRSSISIHQKKILFYKSFLHLRIKILLNEKSNGFCSRMREYVCL